MPGRARSPEAAAEGSAPMSWTIGRSQLDDKCNSVLPEPVEWLAWAPTCRQRRTSDPAAAGAHRLQRGAGPRAVALAGRRARGVVGGAQHRALRVPPPDSARARPVAAFAAPGHPRLRPARLRQPGRRVAPDGTVRPLRAAVHGILVDGGVADVPCDRRGHAEPLVGTDVARPVQHALPLEHGRGRRTRRHRRMPADPPPVHRQAAAGLVFTGGVQHAQHAGPGGRGRHHLPVRPLP